MSRNSAPSAPVTATAPSAPLPPGARAGDTLDGFLYALGAYVIWGFMPLYMKTLAHASPIEVIAHRMIWSLPVALAVLVLQGGMGQLRVALSTPRMLGMGFVTAALISVNWGIYVWAVNNGHALDAALGYYINPLVSVLLGAVLLGERLRGIQWLAILSALTGVAILTWENGGLPVVALSLTASWALYAYFKRALPVGPNQGFALEVLILFPFGLIAIIWFTTQGQGHFMTGSTHDTLFLMGCGLITAIPLMLYANGAKGLRLTTIAMMQYIAPSMIFVTAVFLFNEPFSSTKLLAFAFIWGSLAIYSISLLRRP